MATATKTKTEKPKKGKKTKKAVPEVEPEGLAATVNEAVMAGVDAQPEEEDTLGQSPLEAERELLAVEQQEQWEATEALRVAQQKQAVATRDREAEREAKALGDFRATVGRDALAEAVAIASRGISGRSTQPVQNNILLESGEGKGYGPDSLRLTATDLEFIQLHVSIPAGNTGVGAFTLPGPFLQALTARLPEADVELTGEIAKKPGSNLYAGSGQAGVNSGRTRAHLRGMSAEDFEMLPPMPEEGVVRFEVEQGELKRALEAVRVAISTEATRPTLTGMLWQVTTWGVEFVATDTHRLCLRQVRCEVNGLRPSGANTIPEGQMVDYAAHGIADGFIVSATAIAEVCSLCKPDAELPVRVALSPEQGEFVIGTVTVGTRLIEGQFPDYHKVVPDCCYKRLTLNTKELDAALRRILLVAREDAYRVSFEAQDGALRVFAESPDVGDMEETIEAELLRAVEKGKWGPANGDEVALALNGRYALDALAGVHTEKVRIQCAGPLNPLLIEPVGGPEQAYVLMPMQK